jgi:glycine/sarcosine/betaine reductase complex component A
MNYQLGINGSNLNEPKDDRLVMEGGEELAIIQGKKVVIIGDRDGIPGPAIAECVVSAGGEVVFSSTECFV